MDGNGFSRTLSTTLQHRCRSNAHSQSQNGNDSNTGIPSQHSQAVAKVVPNARHLVPLAKLQVDFYIALEELRQLKRRSQGLSCVIGNFHAQFLEGWTGVIPSGYSVPYSFLVRLFHPLLHAGLSRRTAIAMFRQPILGTSETSCMEGCALLAQNIFSSCAICRMSLLTSE
jgi:hypothetical protein